MKELKTIQDAGFFISQFRELQKISRQVHNLDINSCNYGLTDRQEKREDKLIKKASEIAERFNLKVYHQGDPRGCSLWLTENGENSGSNYTNGIAVY